MADEPEADREDRPHLDRRGFLKGAALGTAALAAAGGAQDAAAQRRPAVPPPDSATAQAETGGPVPPTPSIVVEHPQSDYMADILESLGFDYVAANPGSSFDAIQESIVNYKHNRQPQFLTCCHEESAVAMAHGYAKIAGKPMAVLLHGVIGVQHGSMAIYNAYGDRVPVYLMAGLGRNAVRAHAATDMAAMVRDYVKWDHQPISLGDFASSAVQAYRLGMTPPTGPTLLVVDLDLQTAPLPKRPPPLPPVTLPKPPAADAGSLREIARRLVAAENPKIRCGRVARTDEGIALLVELAELLEAPVDGGRDRVNFPSRHPLAGSGSGDADVVLNLETSGRTPSASSGSQLTISSEELMVTGNFDITPRPAQGELIVAADAQSSLPGLIDEVRRLITRERRRAFAARGKRTAQANVAQRVADLQQAGAGWDASPISVPRLCATLWDLIKNEDWSLVSPQGFISGWPSRMWRMEKHYHYIGAQGAGGMGYGAPASVGAALANRAHGRLSVNIQTDGDMCYAPAVLWTAAHHRIPLLTVMHNNRAYHQEVMFMQRMAGWHNRGADRARIGTTLTDPAIDYAQMARSFGVHGEGPISDPRELRGALQRGIERVKKGEPVLIDVLTQPR